MPANTLRKFQKSFCLTILIGMAFFAKTGVTSPNALVGLDFSGSYRFSNVACFGQSGNLTQLASVVSPTDSLSINGNRFLEVITGSVTNNACTVIIQGNFTFFDNNTFTASDAVQTVQPDPCGMELRLSDSSAIQPQSVQILLTSSLLPDFTNTYFRMPNGDLLFKTDAFTIPGTADSCYVIYKKEEI